MAIIVREAFEEGGEIDRRKLDSRRGGFKARQHEEIVDDGFQPFAMPLDGVKKLVPVFH